MTNQLNTTIRAYIHEDVPKRYVRPEEASSVLDIDAEDIKTLACGAGALYVLPRTVLMPRMKNTIMLREKKSRFLQSECTTPSESLVTT